MLLIFFYAAMSVAAKDEFIEIREKILLSSKNAHQLNANIKSLEKMIVAKSKCGYELESRSLPESCYSYITYQKQFGLISEKDQNEQRRRLDRICLQNAKNRESVGSGSKVFGDECQVFLKTRAEKQKYIMEEMKPEEIILGTP